MIVLDSDDDDAVAIVRDAPRASPGIPPAPAANLGTLISDEAESSKDLGSDPGVAADEGGGRAAGKKAQFSCQWEGCHKVFGTANSRTRHAKQEHNKERPFRCTECGDLFPRSENLMLHWRTHTGERPYECDFEGCGKSFTTSGGLVKHGRIHSGERPHVCDFDGCDKTFADLSNLVTHKRKHTGARPYQCEAEGCGKRFRLSGKLVNHRRIHTGQRPFACDVGGCGKSFVQSGHLITHLRSHTGEKPYECYFEGCGRACTTSGNLVEHIRTHTGERPHVCTFQGCSKAFASSGTLKVHLRFHANERRFDCHFEGCVKSFITSSNLATHVRTHTGERPYVCHFEGCGKAFTQSRDVAVHMRTHTGERPYACHVEDCGKAYAQSGDLGRHLKSHEPCPHKTPSMSMLRCPDPENQNPGHGKALCKALAKKLPGRSVSEVHAVVSYLFATFGDDWIHDPEAAVDACYWAMTTILAHPQTTKNLRVDAHFVDPEGQLIMLEFDGVYFHSPDRKAQSDANKTAVMATMGKVVRIRDLGLDAVEVDDSLADNVSQVFLTQPFRGFANLRRDVLRVLATDLQLGPGEVDDGTCRALGTIADRVVIRLAGLQPEEEGARDGDIRSFMSN
ncbi:hypothetical protein DFJ74DRAFT_670374 [Hyaloraphidium curvatum]|nr:hypothetical protein DFJ74DRAFT_670374 [Hyaloraphidium curvatum]